MKQKGIILFLLTLTSLFLGLANVNASVAHNFVSLEVIDKITILDLDVPEDSREEIYYLGMDCDTLLGDPNDPDANEPAYWIQWSLDVIKYVALIAVFGLSTVDFIKAIVTQDQDAIQKAAMTSAKRFVFAVLIFFLPIVIEFIMTLFGAYGTCGFD